MLKHIAPVRHLFALLVFASATPAFCHEPITTNLTWNHEVSRLIYRHCSACHSPSGSAMSLSTYADARPWAKAIRDEVLARRMPPWDAVKGVGEFIGDTSLSQPEMDLLVAWVEGGAPEGDPYLSVNQNPRTTFKVARPMGRTMRVSQSLVLKNPLILIGILPEGALEVTACLPDRSVQRLLWVRDFRPQWNHAYILRTPLPLPRGTRILIHSSTDAAAQLVIEP